MLLSVCLITKNEQAFLAGCLDSVTAVADEIIVVDSGSVDQTVNIAGSYGAKVLPHEWTDDYSEARNKGIEAARGPWILCIDADERLCTPELVRQCLASAPASAGGFLVERHDIVTNPADGKTEVNPIGMVRLLRRHAAIRYVGIVHERPGDTILAAGFEIHTALGVKLSHLVNHLGPDALRAKQHKYLHLLNRELEADPANHWARYYRGKTLWYLERMDEAQAEFHLLGDDPQCSVIMRGWALDMLGALLLERGRPEEALTSVERSLSLQPQQSLAYCILGDVHYRTGAYRQAIAAYQRVRLALDTRLPPGQVHGDLYMTAEKQAYRIGCCHLAMGDLDRAFQEFQRGIAANPRDAGCYFGLAHVADALNDAGLALSLLQCCIDCDPSWRSPRELCERLLAARSDEAAEQAGGALVEDRGERPIHGPDY